MTHIVALPEDPESIEVHYLGEGGVDVFINQCRFRIGNDPEVKNGSLQLTLLHADVGVLTHGIGKIIAEQSHKREP